MRRKHAYFLIGHVALVLPEALVFVATKGAVLVGIVLANVLVAFVLYSIAFARRTERGASAVSLAWRGAVATVLCLPVWFLLFLLLSWFTVESMLLFGIVLFIPLSAASSGLAALLGLGLFSNESVH